MKIHCLELLNRHLKDNLLIDLFETYDVQVLYEYDRLHENQPDIYHAKLSELGVEFKFDSMQLLRTLFMRPIEGKGYTLTHENKEPKVFRSVSEVLEYAGSHSIAAAQGEAEFFGEMKRWVRLDYDEYTVHYEFVDDQLVLLTLQAAV